MDPKMAHLIARQNFGSAGELPAAPPPSGVIPNFDNPESTAIRLYVCIPIFGFLALASYFVRIFTRVRILHAFGGDDGTFSWLPAPVVGRSRD
jgi:hypothetical protein